ncbi:unnamed protein product, partial [Nesidiocoris tenuis]
MLENTLRNHFPNKCLYYGPYSQHFLGIRSRSMRKHFDHHFSPRIRSRTFADLCDYFIKVEIKTPLFNRNSDVLNYKRYSKGSLASALSSFDPRAFAPSNPTMVIRSGPSIFAEQSLILEF